MPVKVPLPVDLAFPADAIAAARARGLDDDDVRAAMSSYRAAVQRDKARVREMIAKTGHAYLHVGPNGATITPFAKPDAGSIAKKVPTKDNPRPTSAPPSATGGASADASSGPSSGHVFNFHIHDASDPHKVAHVVGKHIDTALNWRAHDVAYNV